MEKIHDSETLAQGQQAITACAFIYHHFDGVTKVFLPKRAKTKKFLPNVFELPGGHIDYGEDIESGLKREIKEEFNMNIEAYEPFYVFTYLNKIKGTHSVEIIYLAKFIDDIDSIKISPEDHSEYVWIAENEISKIIDENKRGDDAEIKAIKKGFLKLKKVNSNI